MYGGHERIGVNEFLSLSQCRKFDGMTSGRKDGTYFKNRGCLLVNLQSSWCMTRVTRSPEFVEPPTVTITRILPFSRDIIAIFFTVVWNKD